MQKPRVEFGYRHAQVSRGGWLFYSAYMQSSHHLHQDQGNMGRSSAQAPRAKVVEQYDPWRGAWEQRQLPGALSNQLLALRLGLPVWSVPRTQQRPMLPHGDSQLRWTVPTKQPALCGSIPSGSVPWRQRHSMLLHERWWRGVSGQKHSYQPPRRQGQRAILRVRVPASLPLAL